MASPEIRTLCADDWEVWREVRLRSLADAPEAFGSKLADWQGANDREDRWRLRLENVEFNAVAVERDTVVGTVGGLRRGDDEVELISMWVAPEARGSGVGDDLVRAVVDWAESESVERAVLMVRRGNRHAVTLYERAGFVLVGPNPDDPAEDTMERVLDAADVATL